MRGRKSRGTRSDDRNSLAASLCGDLGCYLARSVSLFDYRVLVFLDRYSITIHSACACFFAKRGADSRSELREGIGHGEPVKSLVPEALVNKVVPVGAEVIQRAPCDHAADGLSVLAERDAAVHAAACLFFSLVIFYRCVEFVVGLDPFHRIYRRVVNSSVFQKSACFTHMVHPLTLSWKALILASSSSRPMSLYLAIASIIALYS